MINDRDMYYGSYSGGFIPPQQMPNLGQTGMGGQLPQQMPYQAPTNNYTSSQFNDINERIGRLERQVKRLDQRLTRLETPYANANTSLADVDTNMYMM